jgi:flagellar assembly protein FliH
MKKIFSGDDNSSSDFSWIQTKEEPVNIKKSNKEKPKSETRTSKDLEIKKVLSTSDEKLFNAIEREKREIERNVKTELLKDIEMEKENFHHFRIAFDEMDKIKKDAYEKGFKEGIEKGRVSGENLGYKIGVEKAEKQYEEKLLIFQKNLMSSIENIELFKENVLNNAKSDTLDLAIIIAKKIINQEISLNPKVLISIIEDSLQNIIAKDKLKIFLNKDDYEIIKDEKFTLSNAEKIVFTSDSRLKRGEIKIESDLEQLNYSINENVDKLGEVLKDELF